MLPVVTAVPASWFPRSSCDWGGWSERTVGAARSLNGLGSDTGMGCVPGGTVAVGPGSCVGGGAGGASAGQADLA